MVAVRQRVELLEKNKPQQERAKRTYEAYPGCGRGAAG